MNFNEISETTLALAKKFCKEQGGGSLDHNLLKNRNLGDQHSISSISGLSSILEQLASQAEVDDLSQTVAQSIANVVQSIEETNNDVSELTKAHEELDDTVDSLSNDVAGNNEQIITLNAKIGSIDGQLTYLPPSELGNNPTQEQLSTYAKIYESTPLQNSLLIKNISDNTEWIYNATTEQWVNYGTPDYTNLVTYTHLGTGIDLHTITNYGFFSADGMCDNSPTPEVFKNWNIIALMQNEHKRSLIVVDADTGKIYETHFANNVWSNYEEFATHTMLETKEDRYTVSQNLPDSITTHSEYYLGEQTSLEPVLENPTDLSKVNEIIIAFYSGSTATTLTLGENVIYDESFTVGTNTFYELSFKFMRIKDNWLWVMKSGGESYVV